MSYRVTTAEVKAIMMSDYPDDLVDASPFIAIASAVTNTLIGEVATEFLQPIELFLSAHYIIGKDIQRTRASEAEDQYWYKTGYGFKLTSYGQKAIALDTSGTLLSMSEDVNKKLRQSEAYRF